MRLNNVNLTPTMRCNLRCALCGVLVPQYDYRPHMTVQEFSQTLEALFAVVDRVGRLQITGGEPLLPPELAPAYEPLVRESDPDAARYVKAADKLSAYIKCVEEGKAGNAEFKKAAEQTLAALKAMDMEELDWFMERFLPAFSLTLDELQ